MEPETFRQWLSEHGCTFEAGNGTVRTHGCAHVIVRLGDRSVVLRGRGEEAA
jgi:hypothetical protein